MRYVLSEPKENEKWTGEIGRMSEDLAASLFESDSKFYSDYCLVCGPQPFNELCEKTLRSIGFDEKRMHYFRGWSVTFRQFSIRSILNNSILLPKKIRTIKRAPMIPICDLKQQKQENIFLKIFSI